MLVIVSTHKTRMINVRLTEKAHDDFKLACKLRGVSMSSLMHQFVFRTIREEREIDPKAFETQRQEKEGVLTKDEKEFNRAIEKLKPRRGTDQ